MFARAFAALAVLLAGCTLYVDDEPEPEPPGGGPLAEGDPPPDRADPGVTPPQQPPAAVLTVCPGLPYTTIQAALDAAPARATVQVCPGTYHERLVFDRGVTLVAITDAAGTHITADGAGRPVTIDGVIDPVTIDGFTLENGVAEHGGGLYCDGTILVLRDSVLTGNRAHQDGGGFFAEACVLHVDRIEVTGNQAGDQGGGLFADSSGGNLRAIHVADNQAGRAGGGAAILSALRVTDSRFEHNHASDGGGVLAWEGPTFEFNAIVENTATRGGGMQTSRDVSLAHNLIADNQAQIGGGLYVLDGTPRLSHDVVRGNQATSDAGGMRVLNAELVLDHVTVDDNHAGRDGGGIQIANTDARLIATTVTGNVADGSGGGIHSTLDSDLELRGATIDDNLAAERGGGVYQATTATTATNTRFQGNRAAAGGAIFATGNAVVPIVLDFLVLHANVAADGAALVLEAPHLTLRGSILFANTGDAQVVVRAPSPQLTWLHNDTFPASFTGMADPTGTSGNLAAAPAFRDPAYHLLPDSPCVDAGPPGFIDLDGSRADLGLWGGPDADDVTP